MYIRLHASPRYSSMEFVTRNTLKTCLFREIVGSIVSRYLSIIHFINEIDTRHTLLLKSMLACYRQNYRQRSGETLKRLIRVYIVATNNAYY